MFKLNNLVFASARKSEAGLTVEAEVTMYQAILSARPVFSSDSFCTLQILSACSWKGVFWLSSPTLHMFTGLLVPGLVPLSLASSRVLALVLLVSLYGELT